MEGKFYWLKMKRDFFKRHDIQILESLPNGKEYELFYLKLMLESIDHNGSLRFNETIPYDEQMLSTITNTSIDTVHNAIQVLVKLEMMTILDDGTYYLGEVQKLIGSSADNDNANRQRRYREKKALENGNSPKALQNVTDVVTKNNESKSIDIEIEIEKKENNIKEKKFSFGKYNRIKLTQTEYDRLLEEYGKPKVDEVIERLDEYVESNNNKNHYSNYNLVIRRAIRENWFKLHDKPKNEEWVDNFFDNIEDGFNKKK